MNNFPKPPKPKAERTPEIKTQALQVKREAVLEASETIGLLRESLSNKVLGDPNVMKFLSEYFVCRSVAQAAKAAGLTTREGNQLRKRRDINAAISRVTEQASFRAGYDATEIIYRVKEIADVDLVEFQKPDGSFIESLHDISPESRRAVKSFKAKNLYELDANGMKVVVGKLIEVSFHDKLKANELLGVENNLFKAKVNVEHTMSANMSNVLLESKARAEAVVAEFTEVKGE